MTTPFTILVLPYRYDEENQVQVSILKRKNQQFWQFIRGSGKAGESAEEAALSLLAKEFCLPKNFFPLTPLISLSTSTPGLSARLTIHHHRRLPVKCFAYDLSNPKENVNIFKDDTMYQWISYDKAAALLHFALDKRALKELARRLRK